MSDKPTITLEEGHSVKHIQRMADAINCDAVPVGSNSYKFVSRVPLPKNNVIRMPTRPRAVSPQPNGAA